ncbi:MAG: pectate lyase [Verrucomicrobiae bacterium]|nr:pectate lyase [Verrucomicrobiae bacterium]
MRAAAAQALKKACTYYFEKVATHGGYVYYYSPDLQQRWGEGKPSRDTIFVQPPGTPTVGMAYLKAYQATGDKFYLQAAQKAAEALVQGQLESGGWAQVIHFARPQKGRVGKYRKGIPGSWNVSSLDDGQTQAALEFMARADQALGFQHADIHDAALYGLNALLKAQFPNGAFPQGWREPVSAQPVLKARYPDYDWKTEGKTKDYWQCYTLNDNVPGTVADTLIAAHQVYNDKRYLAALEKLGDFLILAQMPDPQPAWCQQYNYEMYPIWARKFEPPAIAGRESQDALETLIKIARYTGLKKYLEPVPRAIAYLKRSLLPDGQLARFYELRTNNPLYMNKHYQLTYDESEAPRHYGWKHPARLDQIQRAYEAALRNEPVSTPPPSAEEVRKIINSLDAEGRWVSTYAGERLVGQPEFRPGFQYISSAVFAKNVETLCEFLTATKR